MPVLLSFTLLSQLMSETISDYVPGFAVGSAVGTCRNQHLLTHSLIA